MWSLDILSFHDKQLYKFPDDKLGFVHYVSGWVSLMRANLSDTFMLNCHMTLCALSKAITSPEKIRVPIHKQCPKPKV